MTLRTGNSRLRDAKARGAGAFTLIELILVLAMLAIVIGVALPSLKGFFRGRNLDSEVRRFLSLTRYGQSRAVSEGVPIVLWIDVRQRTYGLETAAGYSDTDTKAVEFTFDNDLQVEVQAPPATTAASLMGQTAPVAGNLPMIRFTPDGFIGDSSPAGVRFGQGEAEAVWIVQSTNGLNYEIQSNPSPSVRR